MQKIDVRSDNTSSVNKMKKAFQDPENIIIVAIVADWCGACQQFKPIWNNTIVEYIKNQTDSGKKKKIILGTVQDTSIHEFNLSNIQGFPSIRVIKDNKTLHEKLGGMPEYLIIEHINKYKNMPGIASCVSKKIKTSVKKGKKSKRKSKTKKSKRNTKSKKSRRNTKSKKSRRNTKKKK